MSRLILGAVSVVTIFAAPNAFAQDLTFKKGAVVTGQSKVITELVKTETDIEVKSNGQVMQTLNSTRIEDNKAFVTVQSVKGGVIEAVRVEVKNRSVEEDGPNGKRDIPDSLSGKTFVLKKKGDEIVVTDGAGEDVEAGLKDEALRQFKGELDDRSQLFGRILAGKTIKTGQKIKVPDTIARALFLRPRSGNEELKVKACTITLKKSTTVGARQVAVFDMVLKMSGSPNKSIDIGLDFKGELRIAVDGCWTFAMDLKGPVTISGEQNQGGMKIEFEGLGKMSLSQKAKFVSPGKARSKKPKLY